ncbi:MAG: galactokinase [Haliangiales bacterium]
MTTPSDPNEPRAPSRVNATTESYPAILLPPRERALAALPVHSGHFPSVLVRAPGRVNLIGEHTDYNDGFVLPMAIDRAVWIALAPSPGETVSVRAHDIDRQGSFSLADLDSPPTAAPEASAEATGDDSTTGDGEPWLEYIKGATWALKSADGAVPGWNGTIASDVPMGAGLSSSAALELAVLRAFTALSGQAWGPAEMAQLAQKAEREWVGMSCGIMDQLAVAAGKRGHALLIDCRSLDIEYVPLPPDLAVVVLDTDTRRGLVDSAYNERRAQCEEAARALGVSALRDATLAMLEAAAPDLDPLTVRRARHVISENARTLACADAMRAGDAAEMGRLMDASHHSLQRDFEVSSAALDAMVACARSHPACYGARLTGAGFGGCAVALIRADAANAFTMEITTAYAAQTGRHPRAYVCTATDGVSFEELK